MGPPHTTAPPRPKGGRRSQLRRHMGNAPAKGGTAPHGIAGAHGATAAAAHAHGRCSPWARLNTFRHRAARDRQTPCTWPRPPDTPKTIRRSPGDHCQPWNRHRPWDRWSTWGIAATHAAPRSKVDDKVAKYEFGHHFAFRISQAGSKSKRAPVKVRSARDRGEGADKGRKPETEGRTQGNSSSPP